MHTPIPNGKLLRTQSIRQLVRTEAELISHIEDAGFTDTLYDNLSAIVPLDPRTILIYREEAEPLLIYNRMNEDERRHFEDSFLSGAYLLSPFYQAFKNKAPTGLYFLDDVAPDDF